MKKRKFWGCLAALMMTLHASAQVPDWSTGGNNIILGTEWFGADGGSTVPLQIRHDANQPIEFFTNGVNRMRLLPSVPGQNINGYGGIDLTGNVGIGIFNPLGPGNLVSRPHSLLHLNGGGTQDSGFRPWMQTGITMTRQTDQGYFGLKDEGGARNHTVVAWSDNNLTHPGPDLLKFIFVADNVFANGIAGSDDGLEAVRVAPAGGGNESFFGIGDWFTTGGNGNPTERLDILDGRVRIRELPLVANQNETLNKYMVVDDNGVVQWRNLPPASVANCEWTRNTAPAARFVLSGTGPAVGTSVCPDRGWRYGIGTANPTYKFELSHNDVDRINSGGIGSTYTVNNQSTTAVGIHSVVQGASLNNYSVGIGLRAGVYGAHYSIGVDGKVGVTSPNALNAEAYGVWGKVTHNAGTVSKAYGVRGEINTTGTAGLLYGMHGLAYGSGSASVNQMYGVFGEMNLYAGSVTTAYGVRGLSYSSNSTPATITNSYGVHGQAANGANNYSIFGISPGTGANDWSGYFPGRTFCGGTTFIPSDENLKSGIEDLASATDLLLQLRPKSYTYRTAEFPQLGLAEGLRYGFMAQEVGEVFPQWVTPVHHPEQVDSSGTIISEAVDFVGLSTGEIIPLLVGSIQEQHSTQVTQTEELQALRTAVEEQRIRLDQLEQLLAACCNHPDGSQLAPQDELHKADPRTERLLRIDPNPFTDQTTVHYTLERGGRVSLLVHGSAGQHLQVLHEAPMEQGEYSQVWRTNDLAPGTYYVSLLLDGEPLVKRAVKVQ
jgi:hypothetical protein